MPELPRIVPGATTIAVSSGKGGVGKTTLAVTLATALAAAGKDVVVIDADITGPNVHIIADLPDTTWKVRAGELFIELPTAPAGFRVCSPTAATGRSISLHDLIDVVRFTRPADVVIVDLPPGWASEHQDVAATFPDWVVMPFNPTATAIADHRLHAAAWNSEWKNACGKLAEKDKRIKWNFPARPSTVTVETLARFTGIAETTGDTVTVRRHDALPAADVQAAVNPAVSLPSLGISALAGSEEIATLLATLLPD